MEPMETMHFWDVERDGRSYCESCRQFECDGSCLDIMLEAMSDEEIEALSQNVVVVF